MKKHSTPRAGMFVPTPILKGSGMVMEVRSSSNSRMG